MLLNLLHVRANHVDEFIGAFCAFCICLDVGVCDMHADVVLHDLHHETINSPTSSSNLMQNFGAPFFAIKSAFNGFDLAPNSTNACKQFLFFSDSVRHILAGR